MNFFRLGIGITCALALSASRASAQAMGQPVNGISCDAQEGQRIHIHQHLAIFDHGKEMTVPQFIGIPQASRCIYWLHTHTPDGIIHVEAPSLQAFTLGQYFDVWGQALSTTQVASATGTVSAFVNGQAYTGDPRAIPLDSHAVIQLNVGDGNPGGQTYTFGSCV
jgi:hypothetical protein